MPDSSPGSVGAAPSVSTPTSLSTCDKMMTFRSFRKGDEIEIEKLFRTVFEDSEGIAEGKLVGDLSKELLVTTAPQDLHVFLATQAETLLGAIIFTRMVAPEEADIHLLAPVAINTQHQGQGIGQALIKYGIGKLKEEGAKILVTYGDPAFYKKVGFQQIQESAIKPPFRLSQPEGWMAQSLITDSVPIIQGQCTCVKAWNNPAYW